MDVVGDSPTDEAALVLYARAPRLGEVKTRMLPWLSREEALCLHTALLIDSLGLLHAGVSTTGAVPFLSFSEDWEPDGKPEWEELASAARGVLRRPQCRGGLGDRLEETFLGLLDDGFRRIVVIGCDSPTLPPGHLRIAFDALRGDTDAVLAPAEDGGFVLLGLRKFLPGMFEGISWGTGEVTQELLARVAAKGARLVVMPGWRDIDLPEDLERAELDLVSRPPCDFLPRLTQSFIETLRRHGRLRASPRG